MIQGGCPNGNGMGGPGYSIRGESLRMEIKNDLAHDPGRSFYGESNASGFGGQPVLYHA